MNQVDSFNQQFCVRLWPVRWHWGKPVRFATSTLRTWSTEPKPSSKCQQQKRGIALVFTFHVCKRSLHRTSASAVTTLRTSTTSYPASTEMGDRVRVQFPVRDIYLGMWPATQPSHPFVGRRNVYQPKGGDVFRLGVKAGMVRVWMAGKTVWSRCYTRAISEPLEMKGL